MEKTAEEKLDIVLEQMEAMSLALVEIKMGILCSGCPIYEKNFELLKLNHIKPEPNHVL